MIGSIVKGIARRLGYPQSLRLALTAMPGHVDIHAAPSTTIGTGTYATETLVLEEGAQIGIDCQLHSDIHLKRNALIRDRVRATNGPITIGEGTNLLDDSEIGAQLTTGKYCAISRHTVFLDEDHVTKQPAIQMRMFDEVLGSSLPHDPRGPIELGHDVWMCRGAQILGGVSVGTGAVIGAGSMVTKDVEPYEIVAGVPATHRGWRFEEKMRERLQKIAWWEWSPEQMRENKSFFETDLTGVDPVDLEPTV